jgi:hypothetical protein
MADGDEVVVGRENYETDGLRGHCSRKIGGDCRDCHTSRALQYVRLGSWSHQNVRFETSAKYDDDREIREAECQLAIVSRLGHCWCRKDSLATC